MTDAPETPRYAPLSRRLKIILGVIAVVTVAALVVVSIQLFSGRPDDTTLAADDSPTQKPVVVVDESPTPTPTPTATAAAPVVEAAPAAPAPAAPAPAPVTGITSFSVTLPAGYSLPASCSASSVPIIISWSSNGLLPTLELQQWGSYSSARPDWQGLPSTGSVTATFPCTQTDWELLASDGTTRYTAKLILNYDGTQSWSYI